MCHSPVSCLQILKSLSTENVDGFGEEVGKLICGKVYLCNSNLGA